ncbi:hypothetical protein ON010_g3133 [Phytophthora cinnamomi]|nr:hypothetical protein ON010_g3133 [Phytophthora cinnamomi]
MGGLISYIRRAFGHHDVEEPGEAVVGGASDRHRTFDNQLDRQERPTTKAPRTPIKLRYLSFATVSDDPYPTTLSYIVASEDCCECITIPDDADLVLDTCADEVKWGSIQIDYLNGTCNEVMFNVDRMYESCIAEDFVASQHTYCTAQFNYSLQDMSSGFSIEHGIHFPELAYR